MQEQATGFGVEAEGIHLSEALGGEQHREIGAEQACARRQRKGRLLGGVRKRAQRVESFDRTGVAEVHAPDVRFDA